MRREMRGRRVNGGHMEAREPASKRRDYRSGGEQASETALS
jgi:hypothetical protein